MNIVLIGIQGSGKGTLIAELEKFYDFSLVSTGQLLREEAATGSQLGKKIHQMQTEGVLVTLDIVIDIIRKKLSNIDNNIVIFDGFPRNKEQADALDKITNIDLVIYLNLSRDVAKDRIVNRLTCNKCGYITKRYAVDNFDCPKCLGKLTQRADDNEESINIRFETYFKETYPLLEMYKQRGILTEIDANQESTKIAKEVVKVINERINQK